MQILFCTHIYVPTNVYHDWENRSRKEGLMKKQKWCTTGDKYPEAWTRIFMKTLCNWLKTTLKRDAGSNLNNCQCWQEVKGILLSVSGRPRLIYWTHRFDGLALISPRFSSLATFGLLFVVTFNCHKQETELIHTLVCRADYTAFGLVKNKTKNKKNPNFLRDSKVIGTYWWQKNQKFPPGCNAFAKENTCY